MNSQTNDSIKAPTKPPKPEDKPFESFITEEFIPNLKGALTEKGFPPEELIFRNGERPVTGGDCWIIQGMISNGRRFWLCFSKNKISSSKALALAERGSEPTVLESFLVDEKRTTLALLISRMLQRLNGQKWLGAN